MHWLKRFWNWLEELNWDKRHLNPYPLAHIYTGRIIIGLGLLLVGLLFCPWLATYL